ncbi:MAG: rhamnosyltransferase [Halieaceae bacterium]|jgi:rhamnosyltransferase
MIDTNAREGASIAILLSTFDGDAYLEEQIESIRSQSHQNWTLYVRDDGSTDGTIAILEAAIGDSRIRFLQLSPSQHLGLVGSFGSLLSTAIDQSADYLFFCDQDDVWLPDKLERQLSYFEPGDVPQLVYSDTKLVDECLRPLLGRAAFQADRKTGSAAVELFFTQNSIPGCAMAINASLARLALPIPEAATMHDWWLALVASAVGEVTCVEEPLLLYRQHSKNSIGANSIAGLLANPAQWPALWKQGNSELILSVKQAEILFERLGGKSAMAGSIPEALTKYVQILGSSRLSRLKIAWRMGLRKGKPLQQLVLYARLIAMSRLDAHPDN